MQKLIDDITIGDRYRRDLGDLSELAASIDSIGLLNPITVTSNLLLIAGERRLGACRALGWVEIPVNVADNIVEARDLLVAERDENTQRKPMLPAEATALGMKIEELERPAALARQAEAGKQFGRGIASGHVTGSYEGRESREIAAEAVGMSASKYVRIKHALVTADDENENDTVRQVAREAIARINAGAPIYPQVKRIFAAKQALEPEDVKAPSPGRGRKHLASLTALVASLEGVGLGFDSIEQLDSSVTPEAAATMVTRLTEQMSSIRRILKLVREREA